MSETKTEWYFIVNPRAGSGKTMSEWIPAEHLLEQKGVPYITAMTDHRNHAISLAHDAAAAGYRRIAAVGGDGSLHEVLNGICSWCEETGVSPAEFRLAVVPIGSGNDWIKSCRVPASVPTVVDMIARDCFAPMDVVRVKSRDGLVRYMANVGGVGFDSHVCARVNRQKERGRRSRMIYLNALRHTMFHLKPIYIAVQADGQEVFSGEAYSLALGNGPWSGGGMRQVPIALNDDGILDYMVVPRTRLRLLLKELPRLFSGTVHESPLIVSGRCHTLQVAPLDEASADIIELDGEIEGRLPMAVEITGLQINVLKGASVL